VRRTTITGRYDLSGQKGPLQSGTPLVTASPDEFLPFARPAIDAADIAAVVEALESGWITSGAKVKQLEQQMIELTGCKCAVAVSSATAGMHLALHGLGIGPGDEVITPSMTWVSTINLITLSGATPIFVDVDRDTLMVTAAAIENAITPQTRLIIPVHYAGAPLDLEPLREISDKHDIPLLEDAAHALGSSYKGQMIGQSGTAIFSFQAIKNVTTAEGGVICTDDEVLAERLRRLRFHGLSSDAFDRKTHGRLATAQVIEPGYKYNLPDMNACLGLGQLDRLDEINRARSELAAAYLQSFEHTTALLPLALPIYEFKHAWHLFIVRLDIDQMQLSRDEFLAELKSLQIGSGVHFLAAHQHKFYQETLHVAAGSLENTDWNSERILTLPLFPGMRQHDIDRVVSGAEEIVSRNSK